MVTIPNFQRYRQGDFVQYTNDVLEILDAQRAAQFNIVPQYTALQAVMQKLNQAWQPQAGSELTTEIQDLDAQRDMMFNGLKMTVDNWAANHFDPALKNTARIISQYIARHGDRIYLMRYQQQTATTQAIIKDLKGKFAAQINSLGLTAWVATLDTLNRIFGKKYLDRTKAVAWVEPGIIVELINEATVAFRQLKEAFEARFAVAVMDGSGDVADFELIEKEWSSHSRQYNEAVSRYMDNFSQSEEETLPPAEAEPKG